ncbi:MAG TPA: CocE/NonD family hydrolase [Solirubrobacteraceae bacterium]|nr:CocE/NonD family hydrolase [Solirubrobacteraceae bacterium]
MAAKQARGIRLVVAAPLAALASLLLAAASASAFTARGSVEQVYVTGLAAGAQASLLNSHGATVSTREADSLGGLLFREVQPGRRYRVRLSSSGETSAPITVHKDTSAPWDPGIYDQEIPDSGYTYLETRDGTKLAIDVHPPSEPAGLLPGSASSVPGLSKASSRFTPPYPTLIEYSGYGYANPAGPESGIAVLANLMGFAVVDVNMRGTGCSGGAYDFFEALQNLDGYDVIETIAHQPWVLHHKVGMFGISYGGISQLFTAQTRPPDLAAIAPLSVLDATATTLYPGGVLNTGFAVPWAEERQQNAEPASPGHGQAWATKRIEEGDQTCAENQVMHGEATNLLETIEEHSTYSPAVADPLDPITFVHKIDVPTFMACQWEDEQTGGHCADLAQHFTGTTRKWFTFTNGAHIDSLDPYTYDRLYDFLELYVAHQAPIVNAAVVHLVAPVVYWEAMGLPKTDLVTLPPDPVQQKLTYRGALSAFEALPRIRVLFDNGAGTSPLGATTPGNPYPGFEQSFSQFPIPGTQARSWYLGPNGTLSEQQPEGEGVDTYTSNAGATPLTDFGPTTESGGLWGDASQWEWNWEQPQAGSAVSYVSAPLAADTTAIGAGAVQLWVKSSTPDVDFQATVSEVRPDGNETFVQDGWLRASERKLATNAENMLAQEPTATQPIPTFRASDVEPMPADQFVPVTIPLYFEGHAYRAGSRIRVTIAAPNGTQPVWSFSRTQPESATASESIAFSPSMPSSLTLPVVPGVEVPTPLPPCPSLRNEPCRAYQAFVNEGS